MIIISDKDPMFFIGVFNNEHDATLSIKDGVGVNTAIINDMPMAWQDNEWQTYLVSCRTVNLDEPLNASILLGKTLESIDINDGKCKMTFTTIDGEKYMMYHEQDCCECVEINDIEGDLNDLIGEPLLQAEEVTNSTDNMGREDMESFTWTFYKFATIKGYVTIRWLGDSNGYYSESVEIVRLQ